MNFNYKVGGVAAFFEIAAWSALFSDLPESVQLFGYWSAHLLASFLLAWVIWQLLPRHYRRPFVWVFALLFSLQFFIPIIGSVGTVLGVLLALYLPRLHKSSSPWDKIAPPALPYRPIRVALQPMYSPGALKQILREAGDVKKRVKVVLAARRMPERDQIEIFRQAIKDPEDDVRLLAYSLLEEKEKQMSREIFELKKKLNSSNNEAAPTIKLNIAQLFWDMAYLGIAESVVKNHYLEACEQILKEVLSVQEDPRALRLMGRVALEKGHYAASEQYFQRALMHELPPVQALPYMAEAAFYQNKFGQVRTYLEEYRQAGRVHPTLCPFIEFWLGVACGRRT